MTETKVLSLTDAQADKLDRMADGLDVLIRFHDRELDRELLDSLQEYGVALGLGALLDQNEGKQAAKALDKALHAVGRSPEEEEMDLLAAEYADLYLTHAYRVSPSGSVWLTEDKLERQLPMFDVRDWYEHYGISVPDWRVRADDHLVHELQFVSFLCRIGAMVAAQDAGRFMDLHVLSWLPEFCERAQERVAHPVYAAVMRLTRAYLEDLRVDLEQITGQSRTIREVVSLGTQREPEPEVAAYVPGAAESW